MKCIYVVVYQRERRDLCDVVANVLDWDILVGEFELQLRYNVHLRTNTHEKGMNLLIRQLLVKEYHCCFSSRILWH